MANKDFKGATRLSQEVKALIQLRELNSNKLDELMQQAFLKQREVSSILISSLIRHCTGEHSGEGH